ncbi:hypothetical protein L596_016087 [Steinernema carpocapsae]|uniref:Uncharacterized protein n=1 Tax=Steinernema carpocapsae TaxID=34508 RepID=A0A4U5NH24_STECR|nr:hypothetical protein L596_016087 [Steinernema carpocapsae]
MSSSLSAEGRSAKSVSLQTWVHFFLEKTFSTRRSREPAGELYVHQKPKIVNRRNLRGEGGRLTSLCAGEPDARVN